MIDTTWLQAATAATAATYGHSLHLAAITLSQCRQNLRPMPGPLRATELLVTLAESARDWAGAPDGGAGFTWKPPVLPAVAAPTPWASRGSTFTAAASLPFPVPSRVSAASSNLAAATARVAVEASGVPATRAGLGASPPAVCAPLALLLVGAAVAMLAAQARQHRPLATRRAQQVL